MNIRTNFFNHLAQTSPEPIALEITRAEGNYLIDAGNKKYLDLIAGISVCNVGHSHPRIIAALTEQVQKYMHVMVYGETIQAPQVQYATKLIEHLPASFESVFFTNSGAEAVEGTIKLVRKYTGRKKIISCTNSYHGSTTGALSLMGDKTWQTPFSPLLPETIQLPYGSQTLLDQIDTDTAAVFVEPVQAEAGIIIPEKKWLQALRTKCDQTHTLLVFDEIQTGFGRTGKLWGHELSGIIPDILLLGKALGGGMPLGAFISSREKMNCLSQDPVLGHISTFGGHPVCCSAGLAAFNILLEDRLAESVNEKEKLFLKHLAHKEIISVRSAGLLIAVQLSSFEKVLKSIHLLLAEGIFTDWFLFASDCVRIAPPLTIKKEEIITACNKISSVLSKL